MTDASLSLDVAFVWLVCAPRLVARAPAATARVLAFHPRRYRGLEAIAHYAIAYARAPRHGSVGRRSHHEELVTWTRNLGAKLARAACI